MLRSLNIEQKYLIKLAKCCCQKKVVLVSITEKLPNKDGIELHSQTN